MSENNTTNTILNVDIPPSVDNAFQNLTGNVSKSIGDTMSDIWYMVFGGISYCAEKKKIKYAHSLELFRQELDASCAKIPLEKQIEPSFQVTAQALENAKYCITEEELRSMFTSLISNSMNSDFSEDVHPSFAEIIKQMSVLDAKIIKLFKTAPFTGIPLCNYHVNQEAGGYISVLDNAFLELPEESLESCSQSLSSLARLGIIRIPMDRYLSLPDYYERFEQHSFFKTLQHEFPNKKITIEKSVAELTPLGRSFIKVCIPD